MFWEPVRLETEFLLLCPDNWNKRKISFTCNDLHLKSGDIVFPLHLFKLVTWSPQCADSELGILFDSCDWVLSMFLFWLLSAIPKQGTWFPLPSSSSPSSSWLLFEGKKKHSNCLISFFLLSSFRNSETKWRKPAFTFQREIKGT